MEIEGKKQLSDVLDSIQCKLNREEMDVLLEFCNKVVFLDKSHSDLKEAYNRREQLLAATSNLLAAIVYRQDDNVLYIGSDEVNRRKDDTMYGLKVTTADGGNTFRVALEPIDNTVIKHTSTASS